MMSFLDEISYSDSDITTSALQFNGASDRFTCFDLHSFTSDTRDPDLPMTAHIIARLGVPERSSNPKEAQEDRLLDDPQGCY